MDVKREHSGEILSLNVSLRLGGGGEGDIYPLQDKPDLAAKIYHPSGVNPERLAKLRAMLANAPADPTRGSKHAKNHASIAWPVALLNSLQGDVIGFLMPRIHEASQVSDFYDVGTRHSRFPQFSYKHLCRTAQNLASAVGAIHKRGYVIGDVKDENILATENALVTLVDTDSFQVPESSGGRVYRCPVGSKMFTPPELLGQKFAEIDRSPEHDMFGIAVIFFQLLMEGTQPFACVYHGPDELSDYDDYVTRGYFPYGENPLCTPPPWAPRFETLHPRLQQLFRQCFVDGHADPQRRPGAETWFLALEESQHALAVCKQNRQHHYFDHVADCPWCERARQFAGASASAGVAWDPFPQPNVSSAGTQPGYSAPRPPSAPRHPPPSAGAPAMPPAPAAMPASSFTASPANVTIGQSVTLNWDISNAWNVRITNQSGRRIFVGHAPAGSVKVYPARSSIYYLTASGPGVVLPIPVAVSVTPLPLPVRLKQPLVELRQPTPLRAVQVGLRQTLPLKGVSVSLFAPMKLKRYLPLNSYAALKRVSVKLKKYSPPTGAVNH